MELSTKGKTIMAEKRLQGNTLSKAAGAVRRGAKALWPLRFSDRPDLRPDVPSVEEGCVFGSEGDWYSQHVGAAEALRQTMLRAGTLLPPYVGVGGGSSIYDLAYYGLLRPDLILSCLLPNVSMQHVISAYAALGVAASACLVYGWLRARAFLSKGVWRGAVLFAAGTGFFHAHHQIIFVNYMPFLILALMGVARLVSRKKGGLLAVSLCLCISAQLFLRLCLPGGLLSVLSAPLRPRRTKGCGCAGCPTEFWLWSCPWPWRGAAAAYGSGHPVKWKRDRSLRGKRIFRGGSVSVGIAVSALRLRPDPPFPVLPDHGRPEKSCARWLSFCWLSWLLPAAAYVLNGFLYARAKILIPFMPLIALVCASVMEELMEGRRRPQLWAAAPVPGSRCILQLAAADPPSTAASCFCGRQRPI